MSRSKSIAQWVKNKHRNRQEIKRMTTDGRNNDRAYVYVIDLGIDGMYKVGMSGDYHKRLVSLRASNPLARVVVATRVSKAIHREAVIHRRFKIKRVEREVYRLSKSDIAAIQKYLDNTFSGLTLPDADADAEDEIFLSEDMP